MKIKSFFDQNLTGNHAFRAIMGRWVKGLNELLF